MDSEKGAQESTASGSNRDDILRREIVKDLAECLIQSDGLRELSNELERKGMFNNLRDGMSEEEASEQLYDLVENFSLIWWHEFDLKEIMKLDPNERGIWAHGQVLANISNEDSS